MPQRVITAFTAILIAVSAAHAELAAPAPRAFWEGNAKIQKRLQDERAVLVVVRTEKGVLDKSADLFAINGVGWVKRDAKTIFRMAQQYERMKDVSEMFREVKFEANSNRLFVICQALGYQARMLLAVTPSEKTETAPRQIAFKVIDGHFLGLSGTMGFRELPAGATSSAASSAETEVTFRVNHEAREIPIPRILVGFALEILVQKAALKMRTHFEEATVEWPGHVEPAPKSKKP